MDLSYASIPLGGETVKLYREEKLMCIIEDPHNAWNEVLYHNIDDENIVGNTKFVEFPIELDEQILVEDPVSL